MSAECGKCGHDLDYYGGCAVCGQRERAEAAEAEVERLREAVENVLRWDWALTDDPADWPAARDAAVKHLRAALSPRGHAELLNRAEKWEHLARAARICADALPTGPSGISPWRVKKSHSSVDRGMRRIIPYLHLRRLSCWCR